jgi:hypothetical protein
MPSSGMLRSVALLRTDVSEEPIVCVDGVCVCVCVDVSLCVCVCVCV